MILDRPRFIRENTRLQAPPHAPEVVLHMADEITPIWRLTEEELAEQGLPPPFWAFAWAGGQALARYILDHPHKVAGKTCLDLATGSGLVAIAAMKAGAGSVTAYDIDDFCAAAVALNAEANGVAVTCRIGDITNDPPPPAEVILAGDIFYEKPVAERVLAWLDQARRRGSRILVGDPERTYFPKDRLVRLAEYQVATVSALEDQEIKRTSVWTFPSAVTEPSRT